MRNLILALIIVFAGPLNAQNIIKPEIGKTYQFDIKNGTTKQGRLDSLDASYYYITDQATGPDKVYIEGVAKIKEIKVTEKGFFANPHYSRHVFGPSALPHPKGEYYWSNLMLEYNTIQYGATEKLSLGMSTLLFTSLSGIPVLLPNFKYSMKLRENQHLAVGGLGLFVDSKNEDPSFATLPFSIFTSGTSEKNVSAGLGWWWDDKNGWSKSPTFYFAGSRRLSRNWVFQGEWFLPPNSNDLNLLLLSMRYIRPVSGWDFGALLIRYEDDTIALPVVGYTLKF